MNARAYSLSIRQVAWALAFRLSLPQGHEGRMELNKAVSEAVEKYGEEVLAAMFHV